MNKPARRLAALLTAVTAGVTSLLAAPAPASAAELPLGRRTYVVSLMDGRPGALAVRLATYVFGTDGTVTERYWAWRQDGVSGTNNVRWTKPSSGYTTLGCPHACPVRTPVGFQSGVAPHVWRGRWWMESGEVLAIRWTPTYPLERWQLDDGQPGIVGARLIGGRTGALGWGVGSNAPADRGLPLSTIYAPGRWITGPFAENAYTAQTLHLSIGWSAADYRLCGSGRCMQGTRMTAADRRTWYHSYFAANPIRDGRKVYWNNQTGVVQQLENPTTECISASGGGHTNALLQALDDDGQFVGFVGVEASLNQRKAGQDVVAAYAMIDPAKLSAIGAD
ncbi:MAG TPA: hypothetical protein VI248_13570 [Kineosporiaceae bacterium]